MKKSLLLIMLIMSVFLIGCNKQNTPTNWVEIKTEKITQNEYENKQYRLKLDFPSNWTFKENVYWSTVMFFTPEKDNSKGNLGITIQLIASWANLESLYTDNKEQMKKIAPDISIEEETNIKIDNYPAKQIQYKFTQEWINIQQELTMVIKWETVYIINYTATQEIFNDYKKDIDKILENIRIR